MGPNPGNDYRNDPTGDEDWDHLVHPPAWDPDLERVIGWGGVGVVALAFVVLVIARRRGRLDTAWIAPLLAVTAVGFGVGAGQRILTAAVVGANIGGGLLVLFGVPLALLVLGVAVARTIVVLRTTVAVDPDAPLSEDR